MIRFVAIGLFVVLVITAQIAEAIPFGGSDFNPSVMKINEDDYLGKTVPDIKMIDESDNRLSLSSFSKRPLILLLIYYDCPNICPLLAEDLASAINNIADLKVGSDYNVLVLSFNKNDTPEKAREFHKRLQMSIKSPNVAKWIFATTNEEDIKSLTKAVGYRFFYSTEDRMFIHPVVYIFLSPEREITRYIFGLRPDPFSIRLAILESAKGRIGKVPIASWITLACYKYDSKSHGYILNLPFLFASVGVVMAVMIGILSCVVYRKKKSLKNTPIGG